MASGFLGRGGGEGGPGGGGGVKLCIRRLAVKELHNKVIIED